MAQDYPDGMTRMLPGHTVDLENGFARPWYEGSSVVIAAGASGSYTLDFNDDDGIYYIDVVNVSPSAYKEFTVIISINDFPYVCGSVMGFFFFNLRLNPSLLFISGDSVKVEILNLDAAQQTFSVKLQGTKITRPVGFGKCPGAYFTADFHSGDSSIPVQFTDGSDYSPSSWEWDFNDGSPVSTDQNPSHVYTVAGVYYPRLKATNQYGSDTYVEQTPITYYIYSYFPYFTIGGQAEKISVSVHKCSLAAYGNTVAAYIYRDYGANHFSSYDVQFQINCTAIYTTSRTIGVFALGNAAAKWDTVTGGKLRVAWIGTTASPTIVLSFVDASGNETTDTFSSPTLGSYYCRLVHTLGENTATLYIYSDSAMTVLVDTLVVTDSDLATIKFRYLIGISTTSTNYYSAAAYVQNIKFNSIS